MKHRNPYTCTGGENMQRKSLGTAMRYLVMVCALISALVMVGCGGGGEEGGGPTVTSGETISSVNTGSVPVSSSSVQALEGQQFALPGSIFDPSLAGTQATLSFTGSSQTGEAFDLSPNGGGNTTFGSCTFTFT